MFVSGVKQSDSITYMCVCVCVCVCEAIYVYISIIGFYNILNIVPCVVQ